MFKPIKPQDYPFLREFFTAQEYSLCEYSLPSIIAWNHCIYDVYYKIENNNLFISEVEIENSAKKRLLLPLAKPFRTFAPMELSEMAKRMGYTEYYYVPEDYLTGVGINEIEKFFGVLEQKGFMDYVYKTSDMAFFKGHKFSKKRNLIAQFKKEFPDARIENISENNVNECRTLLEEWALNYARTDPQTEDRLLECEKKAVINSLENFRLFEMSGVAVYVKKKLSGFAFGSKLCEATFVLNFEKALDNIKGLYQFLDNQFAKSLPENFKYINKESDLEKPSLIKTKESYYPVRKIKSYILHIR